MEIVVVNSGFEMGGVQSVCTEFANNLSLKGHKVTLIDFLGNNEFYYPLLNIVNTPSVINKRTFRRKLISKFLFKKHLITKKPVNTSLVFKEQLGDLINFLKNNKIDILIMNTGELTSLIPFVKKEIPQIKIIAWQHNEFEIYMNNYYKYILENYTLGLRMADSVVCLTESDQQKFVKFNNNTVAISNPLTIVNSEKKYSDLNSKQILFVGRLVIEQKGLDYLIPIAQALESDWKIIVAGDGVDKKILTKLIIDNNLTEKIILVGSLKEKQLKEFYLSGSIFISTSRWEGFGLVLTEAMSFGLPIVSFNNAGPREILLEGKYGSLIEKNDIDSFIYTLNELIESYNLRKQWQKKSLERALDYEIEKIIEKWEMLFERII